MQKNQIPQKNQEIILEITGITSEGSGIGHYNSFAVFVPYTAVGDIIRTKVVKVAKSYAYGILVEILTPSASRVTPACPVFTKCGGCVYQHIDYSTELEYKQNRVSDAFKRIAKINAPLQPIIPSDSFSGYRNKAQYPVSYDSQSRVRSGFFAKRSHRIVQNEECFLEPPVFRRIIKIIEDFATENNIEPYDERTNKGLLRHIYLRYGEVTGEVMVCLVINGRDIPKTDELIARLVSREDSIKSIIYNTNLNRTNVILGDKNRVVYGSGYINDIICGIKVRLSPTSFYQVNRSAAERLYTLASDLARFSGNETVVDLYCGIGTIGLFLAKSVKKVIGVEIVESAVEDAIFNAGINNIDNCEFIHADASKAALMLKERRVRPDAVVIDPPRKGCSPELPEIIAELAPSRIIYISCNPSTLARDCSIFDSLGYKISVIQPVDLFPRTEHVETVVLLSQQRPKDKIRVELDMTEMDITSSETEATYQEIKDYIYEKNGVKVSSLYIAQVKEQLGIKERECYNKSKSEHAKQPQCPEAKANLITDALAHFQMI